MNEKIMFSKKTDDWSTPQDLFNALNEEFNFTMDPCPLRSLTDGLDLDWNGSIFINPPYSNVYSFLEKGINELKNGHAQTLVYLLASRTDTKWFHHFIYNKPNVEIRFIKGRLKFGNQKNSAPFPSMIVIIKNQ
jgi:site-specific DNA-methyltransferase (adenine-specific)